MSYIQTNYPNAGGYGVCMYGNNTYSISNEGGVYQIIYHVINNIGLTDVSYSVSTPGGEGGGNYRGICTDGTNLYYIYSTGIYKIPIGQTTGTKLADPSGSYGPQSVTNGTYLWLMNVQYNTVDVWTCSPLARIASLPLPSGATGAGNGNGGIGINNTKVWLADINGSFSLCYISISSPTTLVNSGVTLSNSARSLAVDNSNIWVNGSSNYLYQYSTTSPYSLINSTNNYTSPSKIVSNGSQVWFTSTANTNSLFYFNCNITGTITASSINLSPKTFASFAISNTTIYNAPQFISTSNLNDNSVTQLRTQIYCFKEGTKILTIDGYVPIQDLRKGDLVKTLKHNYVPINIIGKSIMYNSGGPERIKDRLYRCSKREYKDVFEDLIITGGHSILIDDFVNDEQREKTKEFNKGEFYITDGRVRLPACIDDKAVPYEKEGEFTIYHFALDNDDYYMNYGIYANGLLVESCSERMMNEITGMKLI